MIIIPLTLREWLNRKHRTLCRAYPKLRKWVQWIHVDLVPKSIITKAIADHEEGIFSATRLRHNRALLLMCLINRDENVKPSDSIGDGGTRVINPKFEQIQQSLKGLYIIHITPRVIVYYCVSNKSLQSVMDFAHNNEPLTVPTPATTRAIQGVMK